MDTKKKRLNEALDKLLNGNFDADSLACLKTILKLIDNIVSKPGNSIVRRIRLSNAAITSKIVARKGGIDILYAIGFVSKEEDRKLLSSEPGETFLVLEEAQEDTDWIVTARNTLTRIAIVQLKCKPEELPKSKEPVKLPPTSSSLSSTSNNFNLYQGHRFDGQAASVGQSSLGPPKGWKSATETQLEHLEKKRAKLQKEQQKSKQHQRNWIATLPGQSYEAIHNNTTNTNTSTSTSASSSKGDAALLADQLKRQTAKRKEEENGGFKTKAMRDLEKIKKQKIYSHTLLAISFPDGCVCKGQFLPQESIQTVMETIETEVLHIPLEFELYMTPPRTRLLPKQTLQEMGLVPAAKIHVSWKTNPTTSAKFAYLEPSLLNPHGMSMPSMPKSVAVAEEAPSNNKKAAGSSTQVTSTIKRKKSKAEKQAEMLKRMMPK